MATQKALYTNIEDFQDTSAGYGDHVVNPLLFYNGDGANVGNINVIGTAITPADYTQGVRKKAIKFGKVRHMFANPVVFPASSKYMLSVWAKPTVNDVKTVASGGQTFGIIATNRSSSNASRGIHIALNNDATKGAMLNVRMYHPTTAAAVDMYSNGTAEGLGASAFNFVEDTWVHIVVRFDTARPNMAEVFINGVRVMYNAAKSLNFDLGWSSSFALGDMPGTANVKFDGEIDEAYYAVGADVWDDATIARYYTETAIRPNHVDYYTTPGAIQLPKNTIAEYTSEIVTWSSPSVDLGTGFGDYGRVQVNGTFPDGTLSRVFTRTSGDGNTWDTWKLINQTGTLNSDNKRFLQVKVELSTTLPSVTPVVDEIQVLDYGKKIEYSLKAEPLLLYKDLATGLVPMGEVKNAYDIIINEEINGEDTLTFKIPLNDRKRSELGSEPVEIIAAISDRMYVIKEARDNREDDGKLYTEFVCEAYFYELRDFKVKSLELEGVSANEAMTATLNASITPTGWTIGRVEPLYPNRRRDVKEDWKSVLEVFRTITSTWGGELVFDVPNKTVHLLKETGSDRGVRFYYNKNLTKINRTVDTYDLVTRLYIYGKGEMGITTVEPNGREYIEDLYWVTRMGLRNKIRAGVWKDQSYTIPQNLLEDGQMLLSDSAKPRVAYVITVQDLSSLSGHEDEAFSLGDTVYTVDKALFTTEEKFQVKSRIVRRKYNVREPWKTVVELNQPQRLLSDAQQRAIDNQLQMLAETDPLDASDATQMTVFNSLLNSRAEEGINNPWNQEGNGSGFTQVNGGFSGEWSYAVTGQYGKQNVLKQRVNGVSHRTAYTVSAMVANGGTVTRGGSKDAFVGIKVVINYTDNSSDTKYLAVKDATTTDEG